MKPFKSEAKQSPIPEGRILKKLFLGILSLSFFLFMPWAIASVHFLTLSDIHYGDKNASRAGEDTGKAFLKITLDRFRQLSAQVDFILLLGDLPTHSLFHYAEKSEYEAQIFHGLYEADRSKKPIFYIFGNNDSLAGNYQPFEVDGKSPLMNARDWTGACVHCEGLMIDDSQMKAQGYYSSYVSPRQKEVILLALNTSQWAKTPFWNGYPNQDLDARRQLQWLEGQLKNLKAKQLLIAMHIPPGETYKRSEFWKKPYLEEFIHLLEQYQGSFGQISLLAAHTHMDELRKISLNRRPIYVYTTPSISRDHYNNPGMKIFSLNTEFMINNYTTYYTSALDAWSKEAYSARGGPEAIFSQCKKQQSLAQCLNGFDKQHLCESLEQKGFYGVKSKAVPQNVCVHTLDVIA